jgi:hypothetical protein
MREWVNVNAEHYPGLRGEHLVGGITTMPANAPFPAYKDVDMHLAFDESSPILSPQGPFPNMLETTHASLMLEGGYKPITEYESAEVVLANPEIVHHLTVDSILYDPEGFLATLQPQVKRDYARRQWVLARLEHERRELQGVLNRLPLVCIQGVNRRWS